MIFLNYSFNAFVNNLVTNQPSIRNIISKHIVLVLQFKLLQNQKNGLLYSLSEMFWLRKWTR